MGDQWGALWCTSPNCIVIAGFRDDEDDEKAGMKGVQRPILGLLGDC